jgi:hypothetical protein
VGGSREPRCKNKNSALQNSSRAGAQTATVLKKSEKPGLQDDKQTDIE